jgi:MFS family permease
MIDAIYAKQGIAEGSDEILDAVLADKASGYYGVFICAGTITAPLVGSFVYESLLNKNWALTCDIFSLVGAVYSLIFIVFNVLPDVHKEKQEVQKMANVVIATPLSRQKLKSIFSIDL